MCVLIQAIPNNLLLKVDAGGDASIGEAQSAVSNNNFITVSALAAASLVADRAVLSGKDPDEWSTSRRWQLRVSLAHQECPTLRLRVRVTPIGDVRQKADAHDQVANDRSLPRTIWCPPSSPVL
jgi:hypothetical protein